MWDYKDIDIDKLCRYSYKVLRDGGTLIVFYDLWKCNKLADIMRDNKFKAIRFLEWIKTNPVPIVSKVTYLANAREVAIVGFKKGKPTFNSAYDNALYFHPTINNRGYNKVVHPTQKPLALFNDLILKHSHEGDLVVDPFLGSGTTAMSCVLNGRKFIGGDVDKNYCEIAKQRVKFQHGKQGQFL